MLLAACAPTVGCYASQTAGPSALLLLAQLAPEDGRTAYAGSRRVLTCCPQPGAPRSSWRCDEWRSSSLSHLSSSSASPARRRSAFRRAGSSRTGGAVRRAGRASALLQARCAVEELLLDSLSALGYAPSSAARRPARRSDWPKAHSVARRATAAPRLPDCAFSNCLCLNLHLCPAALRRRRCLGFNSFQPFCFTPPSSSPVFAGGPP